MTYVLARGHHRKKDQTGNYNKAKIENVMYMDLMYLGAEILLEILLVIVSLGALYLITMVLWRFIFGVIFRVASLISSWLRRLCLHGPDAWFMCYVVRNAAFGGQCKQVSGMRQLPKNERARSEAISDELSQRMKDLSASYSASAGKALYAAAAEGEVVELKKNIHAQLTDRRLAHCQYYCEDEIINRIAELIAAPVSIDPIKAAC
jgi:hypothetical protein